MNDEDIMVGAYSTHSMAFVRVQEIVDALNTFRKPTYMLVVGDPEWNADGEMFCAVTNTTGDKVMWWVYLPTGMIVGCHAGSPIVPGKGTDEERQWLHNIWNEEPSPKMSAQGSIRDLPGVPYEKKPQCGAWPYMASQKRKYPACIYDKSEYTNYALQA